MTFTLVYHLKVPDEIFELHYFPVSKRLTEIVGRLGNFLHRNDRLVLDPMGVQRELTSILKEGYGLLMMAYSGELLGLPQLDPNTNSLNVILKFPDGDARAPALQVALAAGRKYRVDSFTITPAGPMTYYEPETGTQSVSP